MIHACNGKNSEQIVGNIRCMNCLSKTSLRMWEEWSICFLQAKDLTCEKQWNHITLTSSKSIKPLPSVSLNWVNCSRSLATQSGSDYDSGSIVRWAKSNEKVDTMVPILSTLIPVHVPNVFINIDLKEEKISTKTSRSILTCPSPSLSMSSRVSWTTMSLMCSASSGWRKAENSWNSILT